MYNYSLLAIQASAYHFPIIGLYFRNSWCPLSPVTSLSFSSGLISRLFFGEKLSSLLSSLCVPPSPFFLFFLSFPFVFFYFSFSLLTGKRKQRVLFQSTFGLINKIEESRRSYGRLGEEDSEERIIEDRPEVSRTIESFHPPHSSFRVDYYTRRRTTKFPFYGS